MHTKVFKIGAAAMLIVFLSGVGTGTIALSKPQNYGANGIITEKFSQRTISKTNNSDELADQIAYNNSITSTTPKFVFSNKFADIQNDDLSQTTSDLFVPSYNHLNGNYSLEMLGRVMRISLFLSFSTNFSLNTSPIQDSTAIFIHNHPVTSGISIKIFTLGIPPILEGLAILDLIIVTIKFKEYF